MTEILFLVSLPAILGLCLLLAHAIDGGGDSD